MGNDSNRDKPRDRRRHDRCAVGSRASLVGFEEVLGRFLVQNLSVGGALLSGVSPPPVDHDAVALLHLPWHRPLTVGARVVHHGPATGDRRSFGVQFAHRFADSSETLKLALQSRARTRTHRQYLTALVYTDSGNLQLKLERDLARLGVSCFATHSPEDLVRWAMPLATSLVMVDLWTDPPGSIKLLERIKDRAPGVRCIGVLDASSTVAGPVAVALSCCDGTLASPWDRRQLAEAIGSVRCT